MHSDDIKAQLIRQFPAEVLEQKGSMNQMYYSCPTCGRMVSLGMDKCAGCSQILSWKNINQKSSPNGKRKAVLEFEVMEEFNVGDCRRCPISYINPHGSESTYECPLKMRGSCKIQII
ncbi:hypothetical protein V1226_03400 [Lachnospiraceae bacterium JLR.KK009]|nr:hypothetical protein C810_00267 [Lachnospiraceae bacterium A2]MCI8705237.1 hypothetical protein [Lachnospiraceae bacterium]MCI8883655.1 hypothetical protein [Lachnospiraceae bacterium]